MSATPSTRLPGLVFPDVSSAERFALGGHLPEVPWILLQRGSGLRPASFRWSHNLSTLDFGWTPPRPPPASSVLQLGI